nr:putative membrane protein [Mycobacterium pseudoshottsii]
MEWFSASEYWLGRLVLERGVAAVYLTAFVASALQFRALIGEHGMLPVPRYLAHRSFWRTPSVFHFRYSDRLCAGVCWLGAALSAAVVGGTADLVPLWGAMLMWLTLWVLYLSIVNVGQVWYGFGWESLLLETGFLVVFLGNDRVAPPLVMLWLVRWLLFRVEFGAGLIKMRGDACWRNLTCLYYHHETQPMPGPLSWFFHRMPRPLHRIEVAGNHFAQLVVPFGLFAPQPIASIAAVIIIVTQLWLVMSGNFSWLNWLTILLACSAIEQSAARKVLPIPVRAALPPPPTWFAALVLIFAATVLVLSYWPARNMLSPRQRMNMSFNPVHLVNTYGAFGRFDPVCRQPGRRFRRLRRCRRCRRCRTATLRKYR